MKSIFRLVVTLSHTHHPQLASALDISAPIRAVITERGHFNLSTGEMEVHAAEFALNHTRDLVQWRGGKKDCGVSVALAAAVSAVYLGDRRGAGQVMICPGGSAELGWTIDHPEHLLHQGQVLAGMPPQPTQIFVHATPIGHATVSPNTTTEYRVSVDTNSCKPSVWTAADRHYEKRRIDMEALFTDLGIAAAA